MRYFQNPGKKPAWAMRCKGGALSLAFALTAAVSACSGGNETGGRTEQSMDLPCQVGGDSTKVKCWFDWDGKTDDGARRFLIWHPDGGFRRFLLTFDDKGAAVDVADGADRPAVEDKGDGAAKLSVGQDVYWVQAAWLQPKQPPEGGANPAGKPAEKPAPEHPAP